MKSPKFLVVLACGAVASMILFRVFAAEPEYEIAQPVSVTVAGQAVQLTVGQAVSLVGTANGDGNIMVKVTLADGSVSMAQIPQADIRVKGAGAPVATTSIAGAPPAGAPPPASAPPAATTPAPAMAQATQPATSTAPAPTTGGNGAVSTHNAEGGGGEGEHKDWKLVWEDDFSKDGGKIDPAKWSYQLDGGGGGNGEQEYYTNDARNSHIENGELVMTAIKIDKNDPKDKAYKRGQYTSAKLWTKGKFEVEFGRIEACIKAPKAQKGNWPAFWMMPHEPSPYGGWPNCGEIDIMEVINMEDTLYGTDHFGIGGQGGVKVRAADGDFSKDYHVYGVEWEKDKFTWFLDHKSYGSITKWGSKGAPFPAPFDQKFYIILNYAVGGQWPKAPDASSTYPQSMFVKYVRVYQP